MGAYSNRVIADGASYYWRLGEASGTTAVASVGGANGTISGGVTLGQAGAIADGTTAMAFNGTDGKIVTVATVTLPVTCTVEAWVRLTSVTQRILLFIAGAEFGTLHPTGMLYLFAAASAVGTRSVADGQWHHIAYALTGSTCSFYVDGVLDVTVPHVRAAPTTGVANLGWNTVTTYFPGSLDDVAIYPRALTAAEVSAHYALGRTTEVTALGVYAQRVISDGASNFWRLNESSGLVARDIVGAKDGTISGGVTLGQPSPLSDGTSAMLFNGTTGKIDTTVPVPILTPFTIEAWIKTLPALWQQVVLSSRLGYPTNDVIDVVVQATNGIPMITLDYANATSPQQNLALALPLASADQWHHWVVVVTPLTVTQYLDGVARAPVTLPAPFTGSSQLVSLSYDRFGGYGSGSLDEVAIYPRALSASEVAAHYALSTVPVPRDLNTGLYTYLLGVFGVSAGTSYADRVRADGATNHWRLGETAGTTAVDAIGGANGTISGGVTLNQPSALADGDKAMTFNGTTGKVTTAANVSIPLTATVEGWFNIAQSVVGQHPLLSSGPLGGNGMFLGVSFTSTPPPDGVKIFAYSTSGGTGNRNINDGNWHHVVYVLNAGSVSIYVDGVFDVTLPTFGRSALTNLPVILSWNNDTGEFWSGAMDDISIYPRALTANEIAAHYSLGRSGLSGGNDLTTLITRYLATLSGDMTARWKQMEKNAGF